eukprot:GHUV01009653.1.p1 GENE.GHUV01009653.1~~GHUV01009653.1.p1  ORF type:complete len:427 (+),score=113.68 GHUV01009653.1:281-1561(+)
MQSDAACYRAGSGQTAFAASLRGSRISRSLRQPPKARAGGLVLQLSAHCDLTASTQGRGFPSGLGYDGICTTAPSSASPLWQQPARHSKRCSAASCQAHSTSLCTAGCSNVGDGSSHGRRQSRAACSSCGQHSSNPQLAPTPRARSVTACASLALAEPAASAVASAAVAAGGFSISKFVAVGLGYAVLAGSLFRSVPQIMKVLQHQSTEGLSLTSYIVELCCYSISIAYNISQGYGFNTFGEVVACWLQDIVLIALIFRFSSTKKWVAAATGIAVALGCGWLLSPFCPLHILAVLQASNIITMALGSRLPQIVLNMRRGNAGVLSVMTCLLNVAGNTARIFTTVVLTGDMLLMAGYLSQGTLNTILLCQSLGTVRQKGRAAGSSSSSSVASQQQQQEVMQPVHMGPAGPEPGSSSPASFIMQSAAG